MVVLLAGHMYAEAFFLSKCMQSFFLYHLFLHFPFFQIARNKATPARLFKLYKSMSEGQRKLVKDAGFGGLLEIGSGRLPAAISKWLVNHLVAETEEIVIPGRGKIKVDAASVNRTLGLPMGKYKVKYEFDGSAINFINGECNFENGRSPTITSIKERCEQNKEANDDYLRCWLMVAISTFLTGSTASCISPKCYPSLVDLTKVKELNWCQFVVDTLKGSVGKMEKKDAVLGCQYFLTVSRLFSQSTFFIHCIFLNMFFFVLMLTIYICLFRYGTWTHWSCRQYKSLKNNQ